MLYYFCHKRKNNKDLLKENIKTQKIKPTQVPYLLGISL